jgi:hypothetical protein
VNRIRIFGLLLMAVLFACSQPMTVEQQVIATIRKMEEKIEAGERRRFLEHIAADFTGQNGAMSREQVRALVVLQLNRHKRLQAQLFPIHVRETGENSATARFRALVTGGPSWIPESGQVYDFETSWRQEEGDWLLQAANWSPVALDDALDDALGKSD